MHYLQVKNIQKSFGIKSLFKEIDFSIMQGQKIALVARNGSGKSTLLRILSKQDEPDAGEIFFNGDVKVSFLQQAYIGNKTDRVIDVLFDEKHPHGNLLKHYELLCRDENADAEAISNIIEKIEEEGARDYEVKVKTVISKMRLDLFLKREMGGLSGGEEKRVMIARVLLDEADFLFLDEPTNHLDLDMIERLERYLKKTKQTFLLVTHDRYFLERVCSHIFELDDGRLHQYIGNYSTFLSKKAEREEHEAKTLHNMKQVLKKEVEWMKKAPRARASKSVKREKDFYELHDSYHEKKREQYQLGKKIALSIAEQRMGDKVLKVNNISKSFGELKIVRGFSYDFRKQERVGIIGKNGVGKSTFIRLLLGEEPLDSGNVKRGSTITVGHYRQEQVRFDESKRVLDVVKDIAEYIQIAPGKRITAALLLERFLFSPEQQRMRAEKLSGGEKRRLGLLCTLIANPNFLILDEPTNDFDLMTLAVLEEFLLSYPGCVIIISHDRFFMDKLVDHLFVFEGEGVISDFRGSYSERYAQKKSPAGMKKAVKNTEVITPASSSRKSLSNKARQQIFSLEEEIELLEERKEAINTLFQSGELESIQFEKLSKELAQVLDVLEEKEQEWMELVA